MTVTAKQKVLLLKLRKYTNVKQARNTAFNLSAYDIISLRWIWGVQIYIVNTALAMYTAFTCQILHV